MGDIYLTEPFFGNSGSVTVDVHIIALAGEMDLSGIPDDASVFKNGTNFRQGPCGVRGIVVKTRGVFKRDQEEGNK